MHIETPTQKQLMSHEIQYICTCKLCNAAAQSPGNACEESRLFVLRLLVGEALAGPVAQSVSTVLRSPSMGCTYATYSPSLCPTISSVTATSTYDFPLCTAKRRPTKLGRIVAARFVVRIGGELAEKL